MPLLSTLRPRSTDGKRKMPFGTEPERLGQMPKFTNEPVGPKNAGSKGSVGDVALKDAIGIIVVAWLVLFFITYSLRRHNA